MAALAVGLALPAGCAPDLRPGPQPGQCAGADWRALGLADGLSGAGPERLEAWRAACARAGIAPDSAAWQAGRAEGLALWCTPAEAYARGRRGASFPAACRGAVDAARAAELRDAHAFGRRYWDLGLEIERRRAAYRGDARDGQLWPSDIALEPAAIDRLRRERRRHAVWPPR